MTRTNILLSLLFLCVTAPLPAAHVFVTVPNAPATAAAYNLATGQPVHQLSTVPFARNIALSPDGTRAWVSVQAYAFCSCTNELAVIGVQDGELKMSIPLQTMPWAIFFDPKGKFVYVIGGSGEYFDTPLELLAFDASSGTIVIDRTFSQAFLGMGPYYSLSPDGKKLYLSTLNGTYNITVFNLPDFTVGGFLNLRDSERVHGVSVTPDGSGLLVAAQDQYNANPGTVTLYNTSDFSVVNSVPTPVPAIAVTASPDGISAYALGIRNDKLSLLTISLPSLKLTPGPAVPGNDGYGSLQLLISPDGTQGAVTGGIVAPEIIDFAKGTVQRMQTPSPLTYGQFSSSGNLWLLSADSDALAVIDTTTQQISSIPVGPSPFFVAAGPTGEVYVMSCGPAQSPFTTIAGFCQDTFTGFTQIQGFFIPENKISFQPSARQPTAQFSAGDVDDGRGQTLH